jgi:hypothetical protein
MDVTKLFSLPLKDRMEAILCDIASRYKRKRPENYLSDTLDVEVYAIRQWTVRGVPRKHRDTVAKMIKVPREILDRLCEVKG